MVTAVNTAAATAAAAAATTTPSNLSVTTFAGVSIGYLSYLMSLLSHAPPTTPNPTTISLVPADRDASG